MTASKTPAKKAATKSTAKKAAPTQAARQSRTSDVADPPSATPNPVVATADPSGAQPEESKSSTSIAQDILNGSNRWGTGRDRVALLKKAGHDSDEVLKELSRLRAKARRDAQA